MKNAAYWAVLGIEPSQDLAAIRSAYARQLKNANPEDAPEEFKALRAAYEQALSYAKWSRYEEQVPLAEDDVEDLPDPVSEETAQATEPTQAPEVAFASPPQQELVGGAAADAATAERATHRELCDKLLAALTNNADENEILHSYNAVIASPAMLQIGVYAATESWLIEILHTHGPASDALIEPAIEKFGWRNAARQVYGAAGAASVLSLKDVAKDRKKVEAFITRVRDTRHEFYPAYKELSQPISQRSGLSKVWALRLFKRVQRFLNHMDAKAPDAEKVLDADALEWWRRQASKTHSPLWLWDFFVKTAVFAVIVASIAHFGRLDDNSYSASNYIDYTRESCRRSILIATPDIHGGQECGAARAKLPESLLIRQYTGLLHLKTGENIDAVNDFNAILERSPVDPYALYGKGLAQWRVASAESANPPWLLMQQAFAMDNRVPAYFAQFGLETPPNLTPASDMRTNFPSRAPLADLRGKPRTQVPSQTDFDEAFTHFGIEPGKYIGQVRLECALNVHGEVVDCRVMQETPPNAGLADVAIRIASKISYGSVEQFNAEWNGAIVIVPLGFER